MRILVCYKLYLREGDPGIRRFNELCQIWSETDEHEVTVVAGMFNHQLGHRYPDLKGKTRHWESEGRVKVLRLSSPDTYNKGFAGRFWSQYCWARHAMRALDELPKPDVVIGTSPTLWVALPMLAAKKRWKIPGVFEVRDLWPDVIVQMGVAKASNPAVRYLRHLEHKVTRDADHVVTIVQRQKDQMLERNLVPAQKVSVLPNGVMLDKYEAVPANSRHRLRQELGVADDAFVVLFIGAVSRGHDAMRFVDLAQALLDDPQIRLVCIGDGPDKPAMQARARELGLANLSFHVSVPTNALPMWAAFSATLAPNPITSSSVTSAILSSMLLAPSCLWSLMSPDSPWRKSRTAPKAESSVSLNTMPTRWRRLCAS
jgi:colanic acid biosynthesis glycosyl transferase WcaI